MNQEKVFGIRIAISYDNFVTSGKKLIRVKAQTLEEAETKALGECKRRFPSGQIKL